MTDRLPPNLLKLFAPRPPIPYLSPLDRDEEQRTGPIISGLAHYLQYANQETVEYKPTEGFAEIRAKKIKEREEKTKNAIESGLESWKPAENPNATKDPFKTLIVARLAYDVTESDLRKEMEYYGPVTQIKMIYRKDNNKPAGYAFVEFEREKDMKIAYHEADGVRLRGKRIMVDVERGRTVKDWRPRRLGGGLGYTRKGAKEVNQRYSGREQSGRGRDHESSRYRDSGRDGYRSSRDSRKRSRSPYSSRARDHDRYRESSRYIDRDQYRNRDYDRPRDYDHSYYRR